MNDGLKLVGANIFEGAVGYDWTNDRLLKRAEKRLVERGFVDLAARTEHTRRPTTAGTRAVHVRADRVLADPGTAAVAGEVELIDTRGLSDHLWTSTVV